MANSKIVVFVRQGKQRYIGYQYLSHVYKKGSIDIPGFNVGAGELGPARIIDTGHCESSFILGAGAFWVFVRSTDENRVAIGVGVAVAIDPDAILEGRE